MRQHLSWVWCTPLWHIHSLVERMYTPFSLIGICVTLSFSHRAIQEVLFSIEHTPFSLIRICLCNPIGLRAARKYSWAYFRVIIIFCLVEYMRLPSNGDNHTSIVKMQDSPSSVVTVFTACVLPALLPAT